MGYTTHKNIYIYIYTYIYIHTHICNRSRKRLNTQRANTILMTRDPHHLSSSWPSWKLFTSSRPLVTAKNAPKQTRRCISLQHQGVPAPTSLKNPPTTQQSHILPTLEAGWQPSYSAAAPECCRSIRLSVRVTVVMPSCCSLPSLSSKNLETFFAAVSIALCDLYTGKSNEHLLLLSVHSVKG